jgi:outer membrane protein assembly factor BamE (lipoprotein component of BamABCDE complex)
MKTIFYFSLLIIVSTFAQAEVSNSELNQKLDLILNKMNIIEQRVNKLESDNTEVKKEILKVEETATQAISATNSISIPNDPVEKKSFFSNLRNQLKSEEAKASGPWTNLENWSKIRKNMTDFNVRKLLGSPHKIKNSLSPRIEHVYKYTGDLNADGTEEEGIVNITNGRVHSFETPSPR